MLLIEEKDEFDERPSRVSSAHSEKKRTKNKKISFQEFFFVQK